MSSQTFTDDQQGLHDTVRAAYEAALQQKKEGKGNERAERKIYTPQNDLQLLKLLAEDERAVRFGLASTEEQKEICEEIAVTLKTQFKEERSPDSLFYRIRKLLKATSLDQINYRIKGEEKEASKSKVVTKPKKKQTAKQEQASQDTESNQENNVSQESIIDDDNFLD